MRELNKKSLVDAKDVGTGAGRRGTEEDLILEKANVNHVYIRGFTASHGTRVTTFGFSSDWIHGDCISKWLGPGRNHLGLQKVVPQTRSHKMDSLQYTRYLTWGPQES